jgi:hypothetical protein
MGSASIEIREVVSPSDLKTFISVPWSLYGDDPNWVPPLKFERKEALSPKSPFFLHARWKAWIAFREGEAIGRISAQIDELYLELHDAHTGFFGLLESPDDPAVFAALFNAAESWLKEQGMHSALGPFNLGINQELGCLVEGFDSQPFFMMGHARPYYDGSITAQGYEQSQDLLAYDLTQGMFSMPESILSLVKRLSGKMKVRQVNRKDTESELEILRDIFNDAWANNWGFVPFTREEFQAVGKELFMIVPPDFTWIAETEGKPAAFIVMIPNLNEVISDLNGRLLPFGWVKLLWRLKVRSPKSGRIALMGVRRKYQNTRLGPALAFATIQALVAPGMKRKMNKIEMSWILEQNQGVRSIIEKVGGVVSKRYRMYRKQLG